MISTEMLANLFPGIASLFVQDPMIAFARIALIAFGFFLAYLGFKRTLEPLIMVPMGVGMICINCGVLFLEGGKTGTLFLDPLVSETNALMNIMQINFLQPIYNLTLSESVRCAKSDLFSQIHGLRLLSQSLLKQVHLLR